MNYIRQINTFWEVERNRDFTAHLQSFYFALLYFANKFGKSEFSIYREDITTQAKLSNNTYYQVREQAREAGLIDFREGLNKRSKCTFSVLLLYQNKDTTETDTDTLSRHEVDASYDHTHKLTKLTKLVNSKTTKPQKGKADAKAPLPDPQESSLPKDKKKEKEKGSAQKEKEDGERRTYHSLYKELWWEFYKEHNNGEEPPKTKRHAGNWNALKKIQQDLAGIAGDELGGYREFVYILESWPKLKDYHRHQTFPVQIHKNLNEIRVYLREQKGNVSAVPLVSEALDLYKEHFHRLKGIPASTNARTEQHLGQTLTYLKGFKEGNTWEQALKGFEFILSAWPELEKQDTFYADNFTLSYINGNTAKIISTIKSRTEKRAELTVDSAQAWLERNRLSA
jgi:hypothetical protein